MTGASAASAPPSPMPDRAEAQARFLAACGLADAAVEPLAADASFRRYFRIRPRAGASLVLMDAPPPMEDVRPFLAVAAALERWGLHPPHVVEADVEAGFVLLEDLGDVLFTRILAADARDEPALYRAAVEVLVAVAEHSRTLPAELPVPFAAEGVRHHLAPYDRTPLRAELDLFVDWYLPLIGRPAGKDGRAAFAALWEPLIGEMAAPLAVLTLRDYHADNLVWLPREAGLRRVGLLDFQDALLGHPAYDLVSLLQDARRDVPVALEAELAAFFHGRLVARGLWEPGASAARRFMRAHALLGAQRATKIIGIFARLWLRDGKGRYLQLIPRVWGLLERNLAALGDHALAGWYDRAVPPGLRRMVPAPVPADRVPPP